MTRMSLSTTILIHSSNLNGAGSLDPNLKTLTKVKVLEASEGRVTALGTYCTGLRKM